MERKILLSLRLDSDNSSADTNNIPKSEEEDKTKSWNCYSFPSRWWGHGEALIKICL
jgi:hypothetical protein